MEAPAGARCGFHRRTERRGVNRLPLRRLLVVALDNLGDSVMATAVLKPLKTAYPNAFLGFWGKKCAEGLLHNHSLIDEVYAADPFWDASPGGGPGSVADFLRAWNRVRAARFDAALVLNSEWRRAFWCAIAGIPHRIGFDRRKSARLLTRAVAAPAAVHHIVDDHRRLLEALCGREIPVERMAPRIEITPEEQRWRDEWRGAIGWAGADYVAIHPFSGDEEKNWPLTCWIELMQRLRTAHPDLRFLVVFGPRDRASRLDLGRFLPSGSFHLLGGAPLGEVKALLSGAALLCGNDSGLAHIAAAIGVPTLTLFGPRDPARSAPRGLARTRTLRRDPIRRLSVDEVASSAVELLGKTEAHAVR